MKESSFTLLLVTSIMLASCSPRVTVDNLTGQYPKRSADSVMVYEIGDRVPPEAVVIGNVAVKDGGMVPTFDCLYSNMLAMAVKKTAECGGNGLHIDRHKEPGFMSNCHRIWGTMLLMPDSLSNGDVLTTLQKLELNHDIELVNVVKEERKRVKMLADTPKNILKISGGPSFMISKYQVANHLYNSRTGYDFSAAYQHLWGNLGAGVLFRHSGFSFDEGISTGVNLIGPSLVLAIMLDRNRTWLLGCTMTLGYGWYTESFQGNSYSEGHSSGMFNMDLDYKVSKNIALGLQVGLSTMKLDEPEGLQLKDGDIYGFQQLSVLGGFRYYF